MFATRHPHHVVALAISVAVLVGASVGAPAASAVNATRNSVVLTAPSEMRVAVLLVNFANQPSEPWAKDAVRDLYFGKTNSVADYYAELSAGQLSITGSVFGYLKVKAYRTGCYYRDWAQAARAKAREQGITLSAFTNVVYVFPFQRSCWWNGFAADGPPGELGRDSWVNGLLTLYVAVHELGHNLGLAHAASLKCTSAGIRVSFSGNCSMYAYGDPYDVMGYGGHLHVNAWHRMQLGFLPASEVLTVSSSGTYHLSPAEFSSGDPRMLQIQRPSGGFYSLEVRQPFGAYDDFGDNAPAVTGVSIRAVSETAGRETKLIDAAPQSCTFNDAPLPEGRTFSDGINGISITTVRVDSTGADVEIRFGKTNSAAAFSNGSGLDGDPDTTAPPSVPRVRVTQVTGKLVAVDWRAADDDVGVDHYVVSVDGVEVGTTCELMLRSVPLKDGRTYQVGVQAVDGAGNVGPVQTTAYAVPDFTSPTLPRELSITRRLNSIALDWSAGQDNVSVARYRVSRDGLTIAELGASARSYVDKSAPRGWNDYAVVAFDQAGNASRPLSKSVRN